jgi:hypothetical protein
MNLKNLIISESRKALQGRSTPIVHVCWLSHIADDDRLYEALRELEDDRIIIVKDKAAHNLIEAFLLR